MQKVTHPIILFDGICNLCNAFVDFVIRRDPNGVYQFASLQSNVGRVKTRSCQLKDVGADSVILVEGNKCYVRSAAVLRILRRLRFPWSLAYILIIIPRPLSDFTYDYIARNRYRWFGKQNTCRLPTPDEQARFLE